LKCHPVGLGVKRLDKAGIPDPAAANSHSASDDIPIAFRETPAIAPPSTNRLSLLVSAISAALLALAGGVVFALQLQRAQEPAVVASPTVATSSPPSASPESLLGHLPYVEAPLSELDGITPDGGIKLRKSAAKAFKEMATAAAQAGISLAPISGFRTKVDQQALYFGVKEERNQSPAERAKVSAPPGYSEHHTGYAVDIGDGNVPATNLDVSFEKTPAHQWLEANAKRYSFELSFPKNNPQGVNYEPWHWRYVGDSQSLETFYKAHNPSAHNP
jgi:zinc D-Ala-D-Ala carboxypeptidase